VLTRDGKCDRDVWQIVAVAGRSVAVPETLMFLSLSLSFSLSQVQVHVHVQGHGERPDGDWLNVLAIG